MVVAENKKTGVQMNIVNADDKRVLLRGEDGTEKDLAVSTFKKSWKMVEVDDIPIETEESEFLAGDAYVEQDQTEQNTSYIRRRYERIMEKLDTELFQEYGARAEVLTPAEMYENVVEIENKYRDKNGFYWNNIKYPQWMSVVGMIRRFELRFAEVVA